MFLAEVLTAEYVELPADRSLKFPPNQSDGKPFDSIKGRTGGSEVFIVYGNKKAYPSLLVTYRP